MEFGPKIIPRQVAGYGHNHFVPGDDRPPLLVSTAGKPQRLAGYGSKSQFYGNTGEGVV